MEELLLDIVRALRANPELDAMRLSRIIHRHSSRLPGDRRFSKKQLMPFYVRVKAEEPQRWEAWGIDANVERRLLRLIQMKPRRTASGVATITVITKPWACSGACLFCPNDVRMPKSYLHNEPACQRAERNWFDPYLQVVSRLRALEQMGHATDKVELIVLGGTWSDYPEAYQVWFIKELFRALNDGKQAEDNARGRKARYREAGISNESVVLEGQVAGEQAKVTAGSRPFNAAIRQLYGTDTSWEAVAAWQQADMGELQHEHARNEGAARRCVGLVVETRPDAVSVEALTLLRRLGCTKVQMGVQSLNQEILDANGRGLDVADIRRAFALLRLFGFKTHAHFMVNLPGATPESDKADYCEFATGAAFQPDEVKLYPCALIESAALCRLRDRLGWQPYTEDELVDVLSHDVLESPEFMRISRMVRDFSASDIVVGNRKANLRQQVEARIRANGDSVREIRFREIGTQEVEAATFKLRDVPYETDVTDEHFLQWVTPDNRIAGFLRLSLPHADALAATPGLPVRSGEAMIREVHVYGRVARIHGAAAGAQHLGLGRQLVERACALAREAGYDRINVISAVGTREYYRKLGFSDNGLYQCRNLHDEAQPGGGKAACGEVAQGEAGGGEASSGEAGSRG